MPVMEGPTIIRRMSFPLQASTGKVKLPAIGQDVVSQLHLLDLDRREPCCLP